MNRLFEIVIGLQDGEYWAMLLSTTDKQPAVVKDKQMRVVLSKVSKLVRKKAEHLKNFPLPTENNPEPSRILQANGRPLPEIVRG